MLITYNTKNMTWTAKEGNEVFNFEAEDLMEAEIACEMWNATLIGIAKR